MPSLNVLSLNSARASSAVSFEAASEGRELPCLVRTCAPSSSRGGNERPPNWKLWGGDGVLRMTCTGAYLTEPT